MCRITKNLARARSQVLKNWRRSSTPYSFFILIAISQPSPKSPLTYYISTARLVVADAGPHFSRSPRMYDRNVSMLSPTFASKQSLKAVPPCLTSFGKLNQARSSLARILRVRWPKTVTKIGQLCGNESCRPPSSCSLLTYNSYNISDKPGSVLVKSSELVG